MSTSLSRRSALRIAASGGAAALVGAGIGPALASPGLSAVLDAPVVTLGTPLVLRITLDPDTVRRVSVWDLSGTTWTRIASTSRTQTWTAAPRVGGGQVVIGSVRVDGTRYRDRVDYEVAGSTTDAPAIGNGPLIGMNAPADLWDRRTAEVGVALGSRRIFADLAAGASNQIRLVEEAHADGMLPVISYKVGGDASGAAAGRYDAVATAAAAQLASYGLPTAVTVWHEPYKDMTGAQYTAMSRRLLSIFRRDEVRVGPILNGWLLDNRIDEFEQFCDEELFELWQYVAIDTYEAGTMASPGAAKPAARIPALADYVRSRGYDLPLGVGEYNGYSYRTLLDVGEAMFSTPNVWFGCVWNNSAEISEVLTADRLRAFRETAADPRAAEPLTGA
ncbi:hypothetical protein [Nocardioides lacusdianchii]|uniref:hypothetical protein n=1 Tax=Nocardioides lacusdianchii TaxID=2783664 RepID=UPI001CCA1FD7|nr:hypothetical protein [Nocardioides lacusdianchii]